MDVQLKRGMVDVLILALLKKEDSYGYKLIKDIENVIKLSESTLYPVLRRLETSGCLTVYTVEHNARLRKYYAITPCGEEKIQGFLKEFEGVIKVYQFIKEANV